MAWPESGSVTIRALAQGSDHWPGEIKSIEMLGSSETIRHERTDKGLVIQMPEKKPCDFAFVFKLK
ncbi:MAG: alpha-L-fucosidase C-terminal domain-containing protein, partial [Planctomycetota bacterium]